MKTNRNLNCSTTKMPNKAQILAKAEELWVQDQYRHGCVELGDINPEPEELRENGYFAQAVSELLRDNIRANLEQFKEYAEQTENLENNTDFSVDISELFNSGALILGSKHCGKSDLGMLLSDKAIEHNTIITIFDPSKDWISRANISKVVCVKPNMILEPLNESAIYDLSILSPSECVKVVENYAKRIFETQVIKQNRTQRVVIFEECHLYFSYVRSKDFANCVRLLSVGRNISVSCVLISQFCCLIDKYAVRQVIGQSWFGWTKEPNDLKYLKQLIGDYSKELPMLKDGEFFFMNRKGTKKISIEPYHSDVQKTWIIPDVQRIQAIEPIKVQTVDNGALLKAFVIGAIGLLFLLLTVGAI